MKTSQSLFAVMLAVASASMTSFAADAMAPVAGQPEHVVSAPTTTNPGGNGTVGGGAVTIAPANSNGSPTKTSVLDSGGGTSPYDLSTLPVPPGAAQPPAGKAVPTKTRVKGPKADPAGVWKWTTLNRNGQVIENTLRVTVDKKGVITGTVFDGTGTYPITNPVVGTDALTFTVVHHSSGIGDVPVSYTVNLDSNDPKIAVEKPDPTPLGKAKGLKARTEAPAIHGP